MGGEERVCIVGYCDYLDILALMQGVLGIVCDSQLSVSIETIDIIFISLPWSCYIETTIGLGSQRIKT